MPAASPVANLTDFLIFHLQHGNDFALHTHTHIVLSAPCLNVHHRFWHCCPGLILISFKTKAASVQLHQELQTEITARRVVSDGQNSHTIHWLLTRVDGRSRHFQIMSVINKMVSVKSWNPHLNVAYHLHLRWCCRFAFLTICFGASVAETCLGSVESCPKKSESIGLTICTDEYFLSAKNRSLHSLKATFPVLSRQVWTTRHY